MIKRSLRLNLSMLRHPRFPARVNMWAAVAFLLLGGATAWFAVGLAPNEGDGAMTPATLPDTLRVVTVNSPYTYYSYRDTVMGYDYELVNEFARAEKRPMKIVQAASVADMIQMLIDGKADLAAAPIAITAESKEKVLLCGPTRVSRQMLVQPRTSDMAKDVTDLVGDTVTVEQNSRYEHRMRNLDEEIGGGIVIVPLDRDTLVESDMIKMVSRGEIRKTVISSDMADYARIRYANLDFSVPLSLEQRSQWAVAPSDTLLSAHLDAWTNKNAGLLQKMYRKYYTLSHEEEDASDADVPAPTVVVPEKGVSPYDRLFKEACKAFGVDWRLAAAIGFVESRYRNDVVSWAGARGVMQVMPATARAMGYSPESLSDPAVCIRAGVKLIATLDKALAKKVPDSSNRRDFVVAAYNAGLGHVTDAIALAEKYDLDPHVWHGSVSRAALMKSKAKYYRDPVVRNGYFHARETLNFVENVNKTYQTFSTRAK